MFSYPFSDMEGPAAAGQRHAAMMAFRTLSQVTGGRPAIVGALFRTRAGEARNSVFLVDSRGRPAERYDKVHAVPGGEYIPLQKFAPDALVGWVAELIRENAGFVPDLTEGERLLLIEAAGVRFAPLICYEVIYPGLVREFRAMGAEVLLNITNYGWFPETHQPLQANQMAIFRAIETRRPVVVAANTGVSALISATGAIRELVVDGRRLDVQGTLAVTIPLCRAGTIAATVGEFPGLLAACATVFLVLWRRYRVRIRSR
jgi:apolipoprotein N-acyltransferase